MARMAPEWLSTARAWVRSGVGVRRLRPVRMFPLRKTVVAGSQARVWALDLDLGVGEGRGEEEEDEEEFGGHVGEFTCFGGGLGQWLVPAG